MLGSLFFVLFGDTILALLLALSGSLRRNAVDSPIDPDSSTFIKNAEFMFPEDFLSRYPHEANAFRLKIFTYLIFNLLVKGYGSIDPEKVWLGYNRDNYSRVLIDAAFYEYLTNFRDGKDKDLALKIAFEGIASNPPASNEEIAVDRIGEYLDLLSETESKPERLKSAQEILPKINASSTLSEHRFSECEMQTLIQTSGVPGIDFPNFCDIPETSFSCLDKPIPGIYPDFETGCQVFHTCWPKRMDSFLCPIGTIFNQSLLTCDIWHKTGCYTSPLLFEYDQFLIDGLFTELDVPLYDGSCKSLLNKPLRLHMKFMPVKCEVTRLDNSKQIEIKPCENDAGDLKKRLETAYDLVRTMLDILKEMKELVEEKNRGYPWIHVLERRLESISALKQSIQTIHETSEFQSELDEIEFNTPKTTEQVNHSGTLSSGTKPPGLSMSSSTLLKPSKSYDSNIKSLGKQDVPEIVMGSLKLGGSILNEGILLTKQVIMDSYRKIKSMKR